ncbi:expressed unknown protein [Seminavis robusta]|uniref:Uncharacterized protein n=1 Tax=Seminavis robusta TaxID=568900 RepID=A0A9N8HQN0_9STRA|nr:expressed unknown protein [Seminavis robusta]|eukprot:Sro1001_g229760.1 n/a (370) ;mRNA; f:3314-4423
MNSHDARYRRTASFLVLLATSSLCTENVTAFGIVAPNGKSATTKSKSALEISTAIPHPLAQPVDGLSLADRLFRGDLAVLPDSSQEEASRQQQPKKKKKIRAVAPLVLDEEEVLRRKLEWAGRYTSVEALRETFGGNQNKLWGDLQASTARRLYKTLLPSALLELSQLGVGQLQPQDLAPLAYQARVAAKLYARERCTVPARLAATLFDGFRQWLKYGKFQAHGMTYDQVWQKYAEKICHETEQHPKDAEQDVCLKILERSCVSNSGVDALVLKKDDDNNEADTDDDDEQRQQRLLERIHAQLEQDMYQLLLPHNVVVPSNNKNTTSPKKHPWSRRNHVLMVRLLARQRRLEARRQQQEAKNHTNVLQP